MTEILARNVRRILSLVGLGSAAAAGVGAPSLAALPQGGGAAVNPPAEPQSPFAFERPNYNNGAEQFAYHSSHASHASHSSHYSGSGGGYAAPSYSSPPPPSYPPPSANGQSAASPTSKPSANQKLIMVMRVQAKLHALGYYNGVINGKFDTDTRQALRNYQMVQGFKATGRMDNATLAALGVVY